MKILIKNSNWKSSVTIPQEFQFNTELRAASKPKIIIPTREERELEEFLKVPKFKARPIDTKNSSIDSSTPVYSSRPLTCPEPFHFYTDERIPPKIDEIRNTKRQKCEEPAENGHFRRSITIPKSPELETKHRAQFRTSVEISKPPSPFKARPMPDPDTKFTLKFQQAPLTMPEPFHLRTEERGLIAKQELEIKKAVEGEERCKRKMFKAAPMPVGEPFVPHYSNREPTCPQSPHLQTDKRGQEYQLKISEKLIEENKKVEDQRQFKARPMSCAEPFVPVRSSKPLTQISDFVLNSEGRAGRRRDFDNKIQNKIQNQEEEKKIEEEQRKIEEEEQIKEMRKKMEFKARPMPISKPYTVTTSNMPLTIPQSPLLYTKIRTLGRDI